MQEYLTAWNREEQSVGTLQKSHQKRLFVILTESNKGRTILTFPYTQPLQRCIVRIIFHIKIIIFAIAKRCYSCCNVVIGKRLKPTPIKNCLQCNLKFHNKNAPFSKELKKGCIIEGTNIRATEIYMISFKVIQNFRAFLLIRKKFGEKRGSFELSKMFYIFPSSFILMNDFQSIYHAMKSILSTSS